MSEETVGWLYYNPDTGIEFDTDHPINSGKIEDAQNVRPATAANLLEELKLAWEVAEEERSAEVKMGKKWLDAEARAESAERKLVMAVEAFHWIDEEARDLISARLHARSAAAELEKADG
jgi:type II secretory pathway component HofQ